MKISPVANIQTTDNVQNFRAKLRISKNARKTISNTEKFDSVMENFGKWLSGQSPVEETLSVSKNYGAACVGACLGNFVGVNLLAGIVGACITGNIQLELDDSRTAFDFDENEPEEKILKDLKDKYQCLV